MMKRTFLLLGLMCLLSGVVSAQIATTGKITGVATDSSGAVVPNAMVTVKSTALLVPRNIYTGADGAYLLDLLPPGTYEVTVVIKGFRTFTETGIVLTAGFTATVNPKLQLGEVSQTVQVEASPSSICKTFRPLRPSTRH